MEIILQQNLEHQKIPVERISKVFQNVNKKNSFYYANPVFDLDDSNLKNNIKTLQKDIPYEIRGYSENSNMLNIDVKMETGTGKTYVYTKTIFELHKNYGINKFIIAVPSLAIKEGAKSFIEDKYTIRHFRDVCGYNCEIELQVLEGNKNKNKKTKQYFPSAVREFVSGSTHLSNKIYVLLTNIQFLNGVSKILKDSYDNSAEGYYRPYDALKATRPFVIIDEPQKFNREQIAYKKIIEEISPQCILRFGATFPENKKKKDYLNLIYDLNSYEAFNQNLIKGVAKEHFNSPSNNEEKVKILSIENKKTVKFLYSKKDSPDKIFTLTKNDPMTIISPAFEMLSIQSIDNKGVYFSNGQYKNINEPFDVSVYMNSYVEGMIKLAIDRHFESERVNFARNIKIKTLALFFIDDIYSYRENGEQELYLEKTFERLLKEKLENEIASLKESEKEYKEFLQASLDNIPACHAGYFAQDRQKSDENIEQEYKDILLNKKKLLSIKDENGIYQTRRFIFSKWTLKEGWDNPNIFTICKLRSSGSEISKLQEVGRGLRLPVDECGNRVSNEEFTLNYIVDFTEAKFAEDLIKEINGECQKVKIITSDFIEQVAKNKDIETKTLFIELLNKNYIDIEMNIIEENRDKLNEEYPEFASGLKKGKVIDRNINQKSKVKIKQEVFDEMKDVWSELNQKYLLLFNNEIDNDLQANINKLVDDEIFKELTLQSQRTVVSAVNGEMQAIEDVGKEYVFNKENMKYGEFLKKISKFTNLPLKILHIAFNNYFADKEVNKKYFNENTISAFVSKFKGWKIKNLQDKFSYQKVDIDIKETALTNADGSVKEEINQSAVGIKLLQNVNVSEKYLYNSYAYDSELEKKNLLTDNEDIVVFAKIPRNSMSIPVVGGGYYSPDFIYLLKNKKGLVVETKDVQNISVLREEEQARINCAKVFFENLNINFKQQLKDNSIKNIIDSVD